MNNNEFNNDEVIGENQNNQLPVVDALEFNNQNNNSKKLNNNKKKGKGNTIIIVILSLLVVGLGLFIVYDKVLSKEEEKSVVEEEEVEEVEEDEPIVLDIYSDQVQKLYNQIHPKGCLFTIDNLYFNGPISYEKLKNNAFYLGYSLIVDNDVQKARDFTYDEVNKKVQSIFGKDFQLEEKPYTLCPFTYDSASKTYKYQKDGGCGCTHGPEGPFFTLYKAMQVDNEIHIYESVVYSKYNPSSDSFDYYQDYLRTNKIETNCNDGLSSKACINDSTKYKFVYEKSGNDYVFKNVLKVTE